MLLASVAPYYHGCCFTSWKQSVKSARREREGESLKAREEVGMRDKENGLTKWIWGLYLTCLPANKSTQQRANTLHTPPKYKVTVPLPSPPLCCAYSYELCLNYNLCRNISKLLPIRKTKNVSHSL